LLAIPPTSPKFSDSTRQWPLWGVAPATAHSTVCYLPLPPLLMRTCRLPAVRASSIAGSMGGITPTQEQRAM
jgi:hypothetical protein